MAKTRKVPKKIAGVKVSKALRQGLRDLAATKDGRAVLTEALAAAGQALAATQTQPGQTAAAKPTPQAEAAALQDAARSFTDALRRRGEEPPAPAPATTPAEAPAPSTATH
jgi:hypothetical protein